MSLVDHLQLKRALGCLALAACLLLSLLVPASAHAQHSRACRELPAVAWDHAPKASITAVKRWRLDRVPSAKELYLQAMCGANNAVVWSLIERGEGAMLAIPGPLAEALDQAVPYLPPVRYMYVRGGGVDREVIVVLFADGYRGPFFTFDRELPWTEEEARHVAFYWDALPYEFLRRATTWLHDAAKFHENYTTHTELFGGIEIPLYTQGGGRGLANPLGTVFAGQTGTFAGASPSSWDGPGFWIHELGHYYHYAMSGITPLAYTDDFGAISRRNAQILGINVPFLFKERYDQAHDERATCEKPTRGTFDPPFGYVSVYARCGEVPVVEDFADTVTVAMGVTAHIGAQVRDRSSSGFGAYRDPSMWGYDPARLYDRRGGDASILGQKVAFVHDTLRVHASQPQDADFDGVSWSYGQDQADCDERNPVEGSCDVVACRDAGDCEDHDSCTLQRCAGGQCVYEIVDSDGDGSTDGSCGGSDCDDDDPGIGAGSTRPCRSGCGASGQQLCAGGAWTECDAPQVCQCAQGAISTSSCGMCGTQTRSCAPDGSWSQPGACGGQGVCHVGNTRTVSCSARRCGGRWIQRERIDTCDATCGWDEGSCELVEPLTPEICNGIDDDCDLEIDERCPDLGRPIHSSPSTASPYFGGNTTKNFVSRSCAADEAMVGVVATKGDYKECFLGICGKSFEIVYSVAPICARLGLDTSSTNSGAWRYDFQTGASRTPPALGWGGSSAGGFRKTCPAGQVVAGVAFHEGARFDRLALRCAPLRISGSIGSFNLSRGSLTSVMGTIPTDGQTTNAYQCPHHTVMSGLRGHTRGTNNGLEVVNLSFQCASVSLKLN